MGVPGFNANKCAQRNRIAAAKGFETASIRLSGGASLGRIALPEGADLLSSGGLLPEAAEALAAINNLLPDSSDPLTEDEVFIHYCEAASSRFVSDRYCFLDGSTLSNIAKGAALGFAFMNSHRTGGYSTESELPFGKTFCGRYEAYLMPDGHLLERALLGFYMLRDCAPTGANGPNTNTLNQMIRGGILQDVSVGLTPGAHGWRRCDVCGEDYYQGDCSHYAGTTWGMDDAQIQSQRNRGVPTGRASYTLVNWECSEVSGVYDGAVPGAGFAKGFSLYAAGDMPERAAAEFIESFGQFLKE